MSKKKKIAASIVCIVIFLCAISFSAEASLRAAVFASFAPVKAFTMEFEKMKDISDNEALYYITENQPVERATQGILYTWAVYSYGPFHFAKYYGEG